MGTTAGSAAQPAPYPRELEHDLTLRDGARVRIRPIRADDAQRLIDLYARFSRHTAYQRFFTVMRRLPPDWASMLATVDYRRRLAIVAEHDGPRDIELVAVARYEPTDREDTAEVAFAIEDAWQNRGMGTVLLADLLAAAEARGIRRFVAYVLADNTRMLDMLNRFTDVRQRKVEQGVAELLFTRRASVAPPARSR
jgi:RimJ/RimL family protein N-acetyltransferase